MSEGHLGGYIRSSDQPAPSGLDVTHGDPETWTPRLWDWAVEKLRVRSVLDVGCSEGHAAAYFRQKGCEVLGVDGSPQAQADSRIPDAHVLHDYAVSEYRPEREFDLVWSCEFVEHVEERFLPHFLPTFEAGRWVMMTFAGPGQLGWHHVNCQPESYWIAKLEERGFRFHEAWTAASREVAEGMHYRRRGLVFGRAGDDA